MARYGRWRHGENRWRTIGEIDGVLYIVSHTTREESEENEIYRLISARRAPLVRIEFSRKRLRLTKEQARPACEARGDANDRIDTSDIPERVNYNGPVYVGLVPGPGKKRVTIRLDEDVVRWFKNRARAGRQE